MQLIRVVVGAGSIIRMEKVGKSGDMLRLTGGIEVILVYTDDFGVTLVQSNTRHIRGRFDTSLLRR